MDRLKHFAQLIDSAAGLVDAAVERRWSMHRGGLDAWVVQAAAIVTVAAALAIVRSIVIVVVADGRSRPGGLAFAWASIAQVRCQLRLLDKLGNEV